MSEKKLLGIFEKSQNEDPKIPILSLNSTGVHECSEQTKKDMTLWGVFPQSKIPVINGKTPRTRL